MAQEIGGKPQPTRRSASGKEIGGSPCRRRRTNRLARYIAVTSALLGACGEATQPRVPGSIQLSESNVQVEQGGSVTVTGVILDQAGGGFEVPPPGYTIAWESSATAIATVSAGVITGVSPGRARVTARAASLTAAVEVEVVPGPIAGVQLYAETNLLRTGTTLQLYAFVFDAHGNSLPIGEVTWTSLNPELASVSGTGLLTGHQPGWAAIRLASGGHSDTRGFHVRPPLCTGDPVGTVSLAETVTGTLDTADCDNPFEGEWPIGTFADAWQLRVETAATVHIEMTSTEFNAVLYLSDAELHLLGYDHGSGPNSKARISRSLEPGTYLIWASSFYAHSTGGYVLTVE
jgi:hypothetical protein